MTLRKALLSVVMLSVLASCQSATPTAPTPANVPNGIAIAGNDDDEALRCLVSRLLSPRYPGSPSPETTRLLVGSLPENLPLELPIPKDAIIIGSMIQDEPMGTQIIMDVDQPAQTVVDFYVSELEKQGFEKPETPPGQVFLPSDPQTNLCRESDNVYFYVSAFETSGGPTDVRLNIQTNVEYSPCQIPGGMTSAAQSLLPSLTSPPGTVMRSSGGGGSSDGSAYATADFESELAVAELAEHYYPQLETAGWKRTAKDQSENVAWSAWELADAEGKAWVGTLLVTTAPGASDNRFVLVRVDRQP